MVAVHQKRLVDCLMVIATKTVIVQVKRYKAKKITHIFKFYLFRWLGLWKQQLRKQSLSRRKLVFQLQGQRLLQTTKLKFMKICWLRAIKQNWFWLQSKQNLWQDERKFSCFDCNPSSIESSANACHQHCSETLERVVFYRQRLFPDPEIQDSLRDAWQYHRSRMHSSLGQHQNNGSLSTKT